MAILRVRARIATSHPIPAYGGVQMGEDVLTNVARAMADGSLPMNFGHDITRPIHISGVEAGTERLEDGYLAAWVEFDVDSRDWDIVQDEFAAAGAPGGVSIALSAPLAGDRLHTETPAVVAADAHHFDDDAIRQAVAAVSRFGVESGGERLYQFSGLPDAKVILDLVLPVVSALGINVVASLIYDAAKQLLLRRRTSGRTIFNIVFRETARGARKLQIHIETDSPDELSSALSQLPAALEAGLSGTYRATPTGELEAVSGLEPSPPLPRAEHPKSGEDINGSAGDDPDAESPSAEQGPPTAVHPG